MNKRLIIVALVVWRLLNSTCLSADELLTGEPNLLLEIQSVAANGRLIPVEHAQMVRLRPQPSSVIIGFGAATNSTRAPTRIRYKLEGYDDAWHQDGGEMYLIVRFYDSSGDRIDQQLFKVAGDSEGWNGSPDSSRFKHRRETVVVPPRASGFWVVISSAGPPATIGIYVVNDLIVSKLPANGESPRTLLQSFLDPNREADARNAAPPGWARDGTHPSMAKIVNVGRENPVNAFAILDDDWKGHAEWHTSMGSAPRVTPGDRLLLEWNEMYSMGVGDIRTASYGELPAGDYRFRIMELAGMGTPTGVEASLRIVVPLPFWRTPWFWGTILILITGALIGAGRYIAWQKMRREMLHLKQQQILEQERVRIAQDIHDDLGARVTQISLLSAMAQRDADSPEKARTNFNEISLMARELVSALYETVWVVEPENDNLDALGDYLCQMVDKLCEPMQLRCRLNILELPRDVHVSSQVRHNLVMAVKEAIHNVIKHAKASEVYVRLTFEKPILTIYIEDDGCGFDMGEHQPGNGLINMKRRMEEIGGSFSIERRLERGTIVCLRLEVKVTGEQLPAK